MNDSSTFRWPVKRLKFAATLNDDTLPENTPADYEIQYVDIGNVGSDGEIDQIAKFSFEGAPSRARRLVKDGDVILSTVRTYLQAIAPVEKPPENLVVSTGFAVIRPMPGILDAGYCKFALREPSFLGEVIRRSVGISYPAINSLDVADISISVPTLPAQRAIAGYLDGETKRLDELVRAKEGLLGLLAEKRRALITRAVTRGLNERVSLRKTDVEWQCEAPQHWTRTTISRLFMQTKRLGFPEKTVLSVYRDYGVIERASRDDNANRIPDDLSKYQLVEPGDLVINKMKAWQGSLGISEFEGITSPDYVVFSPKHKEERAYLNCLLRNQLLATVYLSMSNGIRTNQWRIEPDRFASLRLFLPPIAEQRAIVAHIATETAKLDKLRASAERTIALLKERRSALISAAVTGRIQITQHQ